MHTRLAWRWHSKAKAYGAAIDRAFTALGEFGIKADGKTEMCDLIRAALSQPTQAQEKDAARYRWLLEHCVSENDDGEKCVYFWCDFDHYNDVNAAIDSAIAAATAGKERG
jgi:hypothetical protein